MGVVTWPDWVCLAAFLFPDEDVGVYPHEGAKAYSRCRLLAPQPAGILRSTNFQRDEPKVLSGGACYL